MELSGIALGELATAARSIAMLGFDGHVPVILVKFYSYKNILI